MVCTSASTYKDGRAPFFEALRTFLHTQSHLFFLKITNCSIVTSGGGKAICISHNLKVDEDIERTCGHRTCADFQIRPTVSIACPSTRLARVVRTGVLQVSRKIAFFLLGRKYMVQMAERTHLHHPNRKGKVGHSIIEANLAVVLAGPVVVHRETSLSFFFFFFSFF